MLERWSATSLKLQGGRAMGANPILVSSVVTLVINGNDDERVFDPPQARPSAPQGRSARCNSFSVLVAPPRAAALHFFAPKPQSAVSQRIFRRFKSRKALQVKENF